MGNFGFKEARVACEASGVQIGDEALFGIIGALETDPGVKFVKRVGLCESEEKYKGLYCVNWEEIYGVVQQTIIENIIE